MESDKKMKILKTIGQLAVALTMIASLFPVRALALTAARVQSKTYSSAAADSPIVLQSGEQITLSVTSASDPNVSKIVFEKSCDGANFSDFSAAISTSNNSAAGTFSVGPQTVDYCPGGRTWVRSRAASYTSGSPTAKVTESDNAQKSFYNSNGEDIADINDGGIKDNGYLKVVGLLTLSAGVDHTSKTIAQLQAIVPTASGETYYCSDCSPKKLVVSTGTSAGNFADAVGAVFK